MKRRSFLHTAAGILTAGFPLNTRARLSLTGVSALARTGLLVFLGDRDCICSIGHAYRLKYPGENDLSALADAIVFEHIHTERLPDSDLNDYIDNKIRQDFEQGDTLLLNGWMLSRTEARQTALYSILYS